MKYKLSVASISMMAFAYIISYYLLYSTPPYQAMVNGEALNVRGIIFTNLITVVFVIIAHYLKKSIYKAMAIVCILFSSFAVLPHSRFLIGSSEIENFIPIELTAVMILAVVVLLMFSLRFNKYKEYYKEWYSEGVEEKEIHKILAQKTKFYSLFNILITGICLFLVSVGFKMLYENASASFIIFTAFLGLALITGCIVFISRSIFFTK